VIVPVNRANQQLLVNGKVETSSKLSGNTSAAVILRQPGHYVLQEK
jgi:hypothetical protein